MKSRAAKVLIAGGIGCGAVIVIVMMALVSFVVWLQRPGELLTPRTLLFPDSGGYAEWTLRFEDEGTGEIVEALLARFNELQRRTNNTLPGPMGSLLSDVQAGNNERAFRELFPMVAVWSIRPGAGVEGADAHVASISIERLGHRVVFTDWLLGRIFPADQVVRHAGERIYTPRDMEGRAFFLRGSEAVIGSDVAAARAAAERFAGVHTDAPGELATVLDATPERPLRVALLNRSGLVEALWLELVGPPAGEASGPAWADVRAVTAAGGFAGADFAMRIDVLFDREATPNEAAWLAAALDARLAAVGGGAEVAGRASGRRVRLDVSVRDVPALLDSLLDGPPPRVGS